MPEIVRADSNTVQEGTIEVIYHDNHVTRQSQREVDLVVGEKRYQLMGDQLNQLKSGSRVRVTGTLDGELLYVNQITLLGIAQQALPVNRQNITYKLAIILFNFSNNTNQPTDAVIVRNVIFNNATSTKNYYMENSFNQVTLTGRDQSDGDVYGYYTIPASNTRCTSGDMEHWRNLADQAVVAGGGNLSGYTNKLYLFPFGSACTFSGMASTGFGEGWSMYSGWVISSMFAHELGHNFGLGHANGLLCTVNGSRVSFNGSGCFPEEYSDEFSVMGGGYGHLNVNEKEQLGYLAPSNVQTVTTSGAYTIAPLETQTAGAQAIRILVDQGLPAPLYYYLQYRQSTGFDTSLSSSAHNGVTILVEYSGLIDTVASTTSWTDAPLEVGRQYNDPFNGVRFTVTSLNASAATINIEILARPVYRFWSSRFSNAHFYTSSINEKQNITAYDRNWSYEGVGWRAYGTVNGSCDGGRSPVYRFYSSRYNSHFYTIQEVEKDYIIANNDNWAYEGIANCGNISQVGGTTPLYRFWSPVYNKHFFTTDVAEKDFLVSSNTNWQYEGVNYYVY